MSKSLKRFCVKNFLRRDVIGSARIFRSLPTHPPPPQSLPESRMPSFKSTSEISCNLALSFGLTLRFDISLIDPYIYILSQFSLSCFVLFQGFIYTFILRRRVDDRQQLFGEESHKSETLTEDNCTGPSLMKALAGKTSGDRGELGSDEFFIRMLPSIVELETQISQTISKKITNFA